MSSLHKALEPSVDKLIAHLAKTPPIDCVICLKQDWELSGFSFSPLVTLGGEFGQLIYAVLTCKHCQNLQQIAMKQIDGAIFDAIESLSNS